MSIELCKSEADHVYTIIHEISKNTTHLKSSYLSWENQVPKGNRVFIILIKKIQNNLYFS